jgi:branched-chain amino acid transport system ATP-binding protein
LANPLLDVNKLQVFYGDAQALWNVRFNVAEKQIFAIIGSNGSGKSTILKAIAGLLRPKTGKISFDGNQVTDKATDTMVELGVSYVPEGRGLFTKMTARENLELGAYTKRARAHLNETIEWVFDLFPRVKLLSDRLTGKLSGGEQQMVAIGRALMSRPRLLMLDEPSLGLAPIIVGDVFEIIKKLNSHGVTILLVEQNIHLALKIADSALVLKQGHITMQGTGAELSSDPEIQKAYMGVLG